MACGEEMTTGRLNIFRKGLKLRGATLVQKKDLGTATHVIVGGKLSLGALLKWLAVPSLPAQPLYHTPVSPRLGIGGGIGYMVLSCQDREGTLDR